MGAALQPKARLNDQSGEPVGGAGRPNLIVIDRAPPSSSRAARGRKWKRLGDLVVAGSIFALLAPVLVLIWFAVRATSPGPGLYWSPRIGRYGRVFQMPKFRTMVVGAPQQPREGLQNSAAHITALGCVLRRWSVDELPQLLCVLKGEMSLVGPRPLLSDDPAQAARSAFPEIALVRPGLSGLAQVRGRNLVSPRRKARLDAHYAKTISLTGDVSIFAKTLAILVSGHGVL